MFKCCLLTTFFFAGETGVPQSGEVLLQDIFAVKVKRRRAAGQESGGPVLGVALFWCRRKGRRLKEDTLHLHNASSEHTHTWYNTLKELLTGNTDIQTVMQFKFKVFLSVFSIFVLDGGAGQPLTIWGSWFLLLSCQNVESNTQML